MAESNARSRREPSRYQRDQRIATLGTVAWLVVVAAVAGWWYARPFTAEPDAPDASMTVAIAPPTLNAWFTESEQSINDLVSARNNIAAAAGRHDLHNTGSACQAARAAVDGLRRRMPSPEPELSRALQDAVRDYATGLSYCILGAQHEDADDMQQAATYITQADSAMRWALDMLANECRPGPGLGVLIV